MAKLWGVKEGPRPSNQSGLPLEVTMREIIEVFKSVSPKWLGTAPPSIMPEREPSKPWSWPRYTVAEIEPSDGLNTAFPKPGYYLMEGLSPSSAENDIKAHRAKPTGGRSLGGS